MVCKKTRVAFSNLMPLACTGCTSFMALEIGTGTGDRSTQRSMHWLTFVGYAHLFRKDDGKAAAAINAMMAS